MVLTNGTFLNGLIYKGTKQFGGGRGWRKGLNGDYRATDGFWIQDRKNENRERPRGLTVEAWITKKWCHSPGDANPGKFSYMDTPVLDRQRDCHMTYTNTEVHELLKEGFNLVRPCSMGAFKASDLGIVQV